MDISGTMSFSSTPRQPLMDLKPVNCPLPADDHHRKPLTPIYTPRNTLRNRRKKSSLAFEDKENENSAYVKRQLCDVPESGSVLHEEDEAGVEKLVHQVLQQCVTDLNSQGASTSSSCVALETTDEPSPAASVEDNSANCTGTDGATASVRGQTPRHTGNVSEINEDELLGDASTLAESIADSTKSEEELLASFVQTPVVICKPGQSTELSILSTSVAEECLNTEASGRHSEASVDSRSSSENNVEQIKPTENEPNYFLENVALMQRVRNATCSVASWVVPAERQGYHVQWRPERGTARLMHSVACSPIPQENACFSGSLPTQLSPLDDQSNELSPLIRDSAIGHKENPAETEIDTTCLIANPDNDVSTGAECIKVRNCSDTCEQTDSTCVDCSFTETEEASEGTKNLLTSLLEEMRGNTSLLDDLEQGIQAIAPKPHTADKSFHSIACSPIPSTASMCEISIQNEVNTRSTYCSPMKIETRDISIQFERNNQSVMCSPIKCDSHNISIQNTVDIQSMMCSPFRVDQKDMSTQHQPEWQSALCSPMPPVPVQDAATQNTVQGQSCACSPMVPRADQDKSTLMCGPDYADQCVGTVSGAYIDVQVSAQPEQMTIGTEMAECLMTTASTSMTPVRLDKKNGKKLTAEDIRRQHPRVLANELETLRMENSRLESHVQGLEKDRKKLLLLEETQEKFAGVQSELSALESRYNLEQVEWQTRLDTLHSDMETLTTQHSLQMSQLKEDYESTNYRDHFFASQKLVKQLQSEIDQYSKLIDDLEQAHSLQNQFEQALADSFSKVKHKTEWVKAEARKNQDEREELRVLTAENEQLFAENEGEKKKLVEEKQAMETVTSNLQQQLQQLQRQLSGSLAELEEKSNTVDTLTIENSTLQKEEMFLCGELDSVRQENESMREEKDRLTTEVFKLHTSLTATESQLQQAHARFSEETASLKKKIQELTKQNDNKCLEATNLQRTLDSRETDIDMLERDLFECRELLYNQQESIKGLETERQDHTAQLASFRAEVHTLKESVSSVRQREHDLCTRLSATEAELAETQDTASLMIKQREKEINQCSDAISRLVSQMTDIHNKLTKRAGLKAVETSAVGSQCSEGKLGASSLVSQILTAASTLQESRTESSLNDEPTVAACDSMSTSAHSTPIKEGLQENEARTNNTNKPRDNMACSQDHIVNSKKKLIFSENSAFRSVNSAFAPVKEPVNSSSEQDFSTNRSTPVGETTDSSNTSSSAADVSPSDHSVTDNGSVPTLEMPTAVKAGGKSLSRRVETLTDVFEEVMRVAHLMEKALRSSLNDVTFENEDLQSQANKCLSSERRLHGELSWTQEELGKSRQETDKLRGQLEEMGDRFGEMLASHTSAQRYQEEVDGVQTRLQAVMSERDLLQTQLSSLLVKMESGAGNCSRDASLLDVSSQREILALQAKVEKYRSKLIEKENLVEEISSKASKRIEKLEANWTKADAEVCRLDELVDAIRSSLVRHDLIRRDKKLANLILVIDGKDSLSVLNNDL